jgi:hypothetical protein
LFGEAEVAIVNENCFEFELEDKGFKKEKAYSGVKELERT